MTRAGHRNESGGTIEVVLASVAVIISVIALIVAVTRDSRSAASPVATTTTISARQLCEARRAAFDEKHRSLGAQQAQLMRLEQQLNNQLTDELAAHSPNAGATDAAHQAVLREQSDVQVRILRLGSRSPSCA